MNATVRPPVPARFAVIMCLITSACVGCAQLGVGPRKSGGLSSRRQQSATLPSKQATISTGTADSTADGLPVATPNRTDSAFSDEQLRDAAAAALLDPNRPTEPSPAFAPLGVTDTASGTDPFQETPTPEVDRLLGPSSEPQAAASASDAAASEPLPGPVSVPDHSRHTSAVAPVTFTEPVPTPSPMSVSPSPLRGNRPSVPSASNATRQPGAFQLDDAPDGPDEVAPVVKPSETPPPTNSAVRAVIRGQSPNSPTPGTGDYLRYPMAPSGAPLFRGQGNANTNYQPFPNGAPGGAMVDPNNPTPILPDPAMGPNANFQPFTQLPEADIDVFVEEARTGKFMFGAGVNSDLGVTGQIVIDERNFDPFRVPTSWDDVVNGTAWRGAGQGFRLEAMPGSQVQRYLVTHTMPYVYLFGIPEPFVLNTSGFYYTRNYFDWNEQRLGGRLALGYRITPDLSLTTALRAEEVTIYNPRVVGLVPQLDRVVGDNELYSGRVTLTHDTRDNAFLATQGHYFEIAYEQTFGSFDYPRGELDYRQYFLMRERPDGSGRHTLAYSFRLGFSGSQTPIYENYFSGGYSTMRGFDFRGASPMGPAGVGIGGQFRFLGSVEYFFPLTADDMIKGVVFCDYGTTEAEIEMNSDNYRVSPGLGLRLNIPAMGPAPLALDFAVPVARAPTDNIQNFSFFFGFSR